MKEYVGVYSLSDLIRDYSQFDLEEVYQKEINRGDVKMNNVEMKTGTWIIGSFDSVRGLSFAPFPKVHLVLNDARNEAQRLARTHPGKEFVVVQISGRVVTNEVVWK